MKIQKFSKDVGSALVVATHKSKPVRDTVICFLTRAQEMLIL